MEYKDRKIVSWIFLGMAILFGMLFLLALNQRNLPEPLAEIFSYLYPSSSTSDISPILFLVSLSIPILFGTAYLVIGLTFRKYEWKTFAFIVCSLIILVYAVIIIPSSLWDLRNINNPCEVPQPSISEDNGTGKYSISVGTIYTDGGKMYVENCQANVRHLRGFVVINSAFLIFNGGMLVYLLWKKKDDKKDTG